MKTKSIIGVNALFMMLSAGTALLMPLRFEKSKLGVSNPVSFQLSYSDIISII